MVVAQAESKLMTGEELLDMGDVGPAELVEGVLVPMSPTQGEHGILEAMLTTALFSFAAQHRLGWVLSGEVGFYTQRSPDTIRAVDVAFVSKERQPERPTSFLTVAPELVIEIVSPSDRWSEIRKKIGEYFAAGVDRVWIVEPERHKVAVFSGPTKMIELAEADTLRGEGALAGFELAVGDLFTD